MEIEVLEPHGMCAGVKHAIEVALSSRGAYCLHGIVHNESVVADLEAAGCRFTDDIEKIPDGATVVFSAHGVAPAIRARAAEKGLSVVDATCPFVARAHLAAREFSARGLPVVVLGDPGHVETKGVLGEIADRREPRPGERIGVVAQTTLDADEVERAVADLRRKYVVDGVAGVCPAAAERQAAVRRFDGDALVVLGSRSSANTRRLAEVAKCRAAVAGGMEELEEIAAGLPPHGRVGLTSGASTPESFFSEALAFLRSLCRGDARP